MNIWKLNTVQNGYETVVDMVFVTHYTSAERRVLWSIGGPENQMSQTEEIKKKLGNARKINIEVPSHKPLLQ